MDTPHKTTSSVFPVQLASCILYCGKYGRNLAFLGFWEPTSSSNCRVYNNIYIYFMIYGPCYSLNAIKSAFPNNGYKFPNECNGKKGFFLLNTHACSVGTLSTIQRNHTQLEEVYRHLLQCKLGWRWNVNVSCFQFPKCDDLLLLFSFINTVNWIDFGPSVKQVISMSLLWFWEIVTGIYHPFDTSRN